MNLNKKTKIFFAVAMIWGSLSPIAYAQNRQVKIHVADMDIQAGYIGRRLPLQYDNKPSVSIAEVTYQPVNEIPEDALPTDINKYDILLGKERKEPFAVVRIPAFSYAEDGSIRRIKTLTLNYTETTPKTNYSESRSLAKGTSMEVSPMATGTWYKISVQETGLHKIDHNFLANKLGVSGIKSMNIRLFGHGAKMIDERNREGGVKGLEEAAIWVNDGGDGSFDPGDYFVFYANGPRCWIPSGDNSRLVQENNFYTDEGYYYINVDGVAKKRLTSQDMAPAANYSTSSYSATALHEEDLANPQKFGKYWWGEEFSNAPGKTNSQSFTLDLGNTLDTSELRLQIVNTSSARGLFSIYLNGQKIQDTDLPPTSESNYSRASGTAISWRGPLSGQATVKIDYNTAASDGSGWLDYICFNMRKQLSMSGNTLIFSDLKSAGPGNIAEYKLGNANGSTQVWDVTDPQNPVLMKGSLNGSTYTFSREAETVRTFVAMNNTDLPEPGFTGTVPNQNLYGSGPVDYIIVTYPDFKPAAERLADFHRNRNGMKVLVATTTQVYNEFSSGAQDISAIRDFARAIYDRSGLGDPGMLKYLLLMGDASYDYKGRINNNTNYVPTFEAKESFNFLETYSNDDFFGFLDEGEEIERYDIVNALDIGVGRLPVKSLNEAYGVVDKIIHYKSPATLGPWRLSTMFVADDIDGAGDHPSDAEIMNNTVLTNSDVHNTSKLYLNTIQLTSTPGGVRAPEANKTINDAIFRGLFLFNYSGHGNTTVLAHERIVTKDDYNKWRNIDRLPFMVTATCDFGQFDQPSFVSSGEEMMLKADGGVIATLTTTHLVYAYANEILNREFLAAQFQHVNGKWNTFGDAMRIGKNSTYAQASSTADVIKNFRKFALLGDPALEPNFPEFFIHTTSMQDGTTGQPVNTIGALGEYTINGDVTDVNGNLLDYFNGTLSVSIFDKSRKLKSIIGPERTYEVRNNIIYKGKATVTNGKFSFSFIAPKDINYEDGPGTISFYADNGNTDAAGRDTTIKIGGYSDNPKLENNPPIVTPYIKDSFFVNGGLTGTNTAIFAILEDETGINVSGNAVGHDLVAILDGDESNPYIMNDYYETASNTFKRGYVYFPVDDIPDGRHRFTVKAWDVNNNSGEGYVDFEVADGKVVKVKNLMNYPNPFRDVTHFVFEHNHPDTDLSAEIKIYTTSGVLVRTLTQDFITTGSHSNEITWDATSDRGAKLPAGVYIYRMMIKAGQNIETTAYQKLVLVR